MGASQVCILGCLSQFLLRVSAFVSPGSSYPALHLGAYLLDDQANPMEHVHSAQSVLLQTTEPDVILSWRAATVYDAFLGTASCVYTLNRTCLSSCNLHRVSSTLPFSRHCSVSIRF